MAKDEMGKVEAVQMLQRCRAEIIGLRAEINRLRPKAEAYDLQAAVVGLLPRPGISMSEDLVWTIDRCISELIMTGEG